MPNSIGYSKAPFNYITFQASVNFTGGLNTTAGPFGLHDNESSSLQNIDFDKFGSILKRNGYTALNTSALGSSPTIDGLHWFEWFNGTVFTRQAIAVAGGKVYYMNSLNGTWNDITGAITVTAGNHVYFQNFVNTVFMTNGKDAPWQWNGSGNCSASVVPTGLTTAKYVSLYNNYIFYSNVTISGTVYSTRSYWSVIYDPTTWPSSNFVEVAKNDGQQITGVKLLGDRLVHYKDRSIYNLFFSGDADIPFVLPNGGKSNSSVGCVAAATIQDVENAHLFLSYDGLYSYDGNNSFKLSNPINTTIQGYTVTSFPSAVATTYRSKNRYFLSMPSNGSTNDTIIVYDWYNKAFSVYSGMKAASMFTAYVSGVTEQPYFGDYAGFVYQMDNGTDDYPLNVKTAINAFYYTNWRSYNDLISQKGIPQVVIYYQYTSSSAILNFSYSYDLSLGDQYSTSIPTMSSGMLWGSGIWGVGLWGGSGGALSRVDLDGRGRAVRFKFSNANVGETFRIDGLGQLPYLQTQE